MLRSDIGMLGLQRFMERYAEDNELGFSKVRLLKLHKSSVLPAMVTAESHCTHHDQSTVLKSTCVCCRAASDYQLWPATFAT